MGENKIQKKWRNDEGNFERENGCWKDTIFKHI